MPRVADWGASSARVAGLAFGAAVLTPLVARSRSRGTVICSENAAQHRSTVVCSETGAPRSRRSGREMRWEAVVTASEPCDGAMAVFLSKAAESDLILRVDESVVDCEPADEVASGAARRYRVQIAPLLLPGLTVRTTALIRVEAVAGGVRYVTEHLDNAFSGRFSGLVSRLPQPTIAISTELRAEAGPSLVGRSDFSLVNPLPAWWPIPDRLMGVGGALIQRLVRRDTQLSVRRVVAECERDRQQARITA